MKISFKRKKYTLYLSKEEANFIAGQLEERAKTFQKDDDWSKNQSKEIKDIWASHALLLYTIADELKT